MNWLHVYNLIDPAARLWDEWKRLAPEANYNTFRKEMARLGGVRGRRKGLLRREGFAEVGDTAVVSAEADRITTLDALLAACKVDLAVWRIERVEINKHEVARKQTVRDLQFDDGKMSGYLNDTGAMVIEPLISVKVYLKRREEAPLAAVVDGIITKLAGVAPCYALPKLLHPAGQYLLVPAIFDAHFNKRSADETYTVQAAARDFIAASEALAARTLAMGYGVRRVLIPAGNDALHSDDLMGHTTKGTLVETVGSAGRAIEALCEAYIHLIERMALIAPVDVVMVPGNHDRFSTVWLGRVLAAQFSRHSRVTVDTRCAPRSYYQFGKTLIGLTHGDKAATDKLGELMAHEARQAWADTTYQEWLTGHWHGRKALRRYVSEEYGVTVRVFPALCPADEWHAMMGFIGQKRAATGLLYHEDHGLAVEYPVFVDELAGAKAEKQREERAA
jgi:hypothetical protein